MGAAITAGALALGGGPASAAKPKHHKTPKPKPVVLVCKWATSIVPPLGQQQSTLANDSGDLFGNASCPASPYSPSRRTTLGKGVAHLTFRLQDTGDLSGSFSEWFGAGSIRGTYVLTPSNALTLDPSTFASSDYTGTLVVTGGTGAFKPALGKGKLTCTSPDSVHLSCSATIKFSELVPAV
jgi:hypothetical protein